MKIDTESLATGKSLYEATLTKENRSVRDAVMTPFGFAMQSAG